MISSTALLELLNHAKPSEGEDLDPRFDAAISFIEQSNYEEALPLIEQTFKEGNLDIRVIMHILHVNFLKDGLNSFLETIPFIQEALTTHWDNLSPVTKRESHASRSIEYFFSTIKKQVERSRELFSQKRIDTFHTQTASQSPEVLKKINTLLQSSIDFFSHTWKLPSSIKDIQYIVSWLQSIKIAPPPEAPEDEKAPETKSQKLPPPEAKDNPLPFSPLMDELIKKINLFETLIQEKKLLKASFIGNDIQNILDNFDPALFFPQIFSKYFSLLAKHIETLTIEWEQKGTPQWDALQKLYQTDVETFLKW